MKKIISAILICAVLCVSFSFTACQTKPQGKDLAFNITKDYKIVIPESASFSEISAAKKLSQAVNKSSGIDLPIINDSAASDSNELVIGNAKRDGVSRAVGNAGEHGYSIYASQNNVFIYGASERALELAVEKFISTYISISAAMAVPVNMSMVYKDLFSKKNLTLNGVEISKYTIVYAAEGTTTHYRSNVNAWVECAKYEDAANAIADEIYLLTEQRLNVVPASETTPSDYEILVGKVADREEVLQFYVTHGVGYSDERYAYGMVGTKLLFSGGSPNSAYFASRAFTKACREMRSSDFSKELLSQSVDLSKVVCIGDDMVHGSSSTAINRYNYAVYLQKMLGFKYYVANYGVPGLTAAEYEQSNEYKLSLSAVPDVVIIMLGFNDANPSENVWKNAEDKEAYVQTLTRMVNEYRKINSGVQIYFVSSTHKATSQKWEENLTELAATISAAAIELDEAYVDVHTVSREQEWVFPDGRHLKNEGYEKLATTIFDALKTSIKVK
ncbi:MAG: hypothetical protein E7626_07365 [Ruminococcaceae bacterium]|nr:hypothetical protein [Oscillospiraceae bacterium]